ncbi:MAG: ATP-dependent DNA ligase, partial [Candidatus Thermoplasmatota archaeon]|nr:ATP-dependent DNA ligase [Candidatus Thermoplasmatota archaeon]
YDNLDKIAKATGTRSQDAKIKLLSEILHDAKASEGKYIVRAVTGNLRLGLADMTILDALAKMRAEKDLGEGTEADKIKELQKQYREKIENAYNLYPDLGRISNVLAAEGIEGIDKIKITLGVPIRAMLAERLPSIEEIIAKMEGKCGFEFKYDGLRIQAHIGKSKCTLFSRRLEDLTEQFPDVCASLLSAFKGKECIVEGECVAVNGETGEMLPFQEISHRRGRKYGVESEKVMTLGGEETSRIKGGHSDITADYPVSIYLFDCLYIEGEDITRKPYTDRREALKRNFVAGERVKISDSFVSCDLSEINAYFSKAIDSGCEGIMAKSLDSPYRAGARGFQWIKYKRDYKSELSDTVDLVVVGALFGHGTRTGKYGSLLMAAYNKETGKFETISRLGTGFDDKTLDEMPKMFEPFISKQKPSDVESEITPDVWVKPRFVMEIRGAEMTLSPVHTCAYGTIRPGSGIAIRFPRFTGKWRDDKKAEDATTSTEIVQMYKSQLKKFDGDSGAN